VENAEMAAKREDGSQGGGSTSAQEAQATLGSIMQLVAMVDMLRDNLVVLGGKAKEWPQETIDISAVVADAVKKAKPLMKASKVKLLVDIAMELQGVGEAQRYAPLTTPLNYAEHSYYLSPPLSLSQSKIQQRNQPAAAVAWRRFPMVLSPPRLAERSW
jgi:hypothetical protein